MQVDEPARPLAVKMGAVARKRSRSDTPWLIRSLFAALVLMPLAITPHTWLYFLGLSPGGSGLTGCLLVEYCHLTPGDVLQAQLPGLLYALLPLLVLGVLVVGRKPGIEQAVLALILGTARFVLPLSIWLVGLHLSPPASERAIFTYCAPESACQFQPGFTYQFITPLEVLSGLTSLVLYVLTLTVWLHLLPEWESIDA
jgi:hypothetical protein